MRGLLRGLSGLAGLGGLALLTVGLWVGWWSPHIVPPGPWLDVTPRPVSTGRLSLEEPRLVTFRITNRHPTRSACLLGSENFCDREGCVTTTGFPFTIPPGGSFALVMEYKGTQVGKFTREVPLFTDCPGQSEIPLSIIGAVEDTEVAKASPVSP